MDEEIHNQLMRAAAIVESIGARCKIDGVELYSEEVIRESNNEMGYGQITNVPYYIKVFVRAALNRGYSS
ncbi:MAG: hypothetical protein HC944_02835 [Nanoarchaeota archaeon]|nr:hypothetical protein [Nanoarchaeota archaeon]